MSRSMSVPWLKVTTLELVSDVHEETGMHHSNCKPKLVQVLRGNEGLGTLLVHDKQHAVTAFLTQGCLEDFRRNYPHRSLVSLKGSLVKLDRWHVSTVVQCAANRPRAVGNGTITFPLCLQVSKLVAIGADDNNVFGDPKDLNRDPQVLEKLRNLNYLQLAERLSERQFQASHLPDVEGQFSIPHLYSEHYQLRWHHAIIVEEEQRVLDEITEFEPVEALAAEKLREYEAETSHFQRTPPPSSRRRATPSRSRATEDHDVEGTQLRFTQTDSDAEGELDSESGMLSQSQRVMTFITQEPLSQQNDIVGTQDSASVSQVDVSPSQMSQARRGRQSRRSSIGLAQSQPLSPMTLELFATIQDGTEWYTQPLTQSLLSTLEEAWEAQGTGVPSRPSTPPSTRRPQTPLRGRAAVAGTPLRDTPLYGTKVVPSGSQTPGVTERLPSATRLPAARSTTQATGATLTTTMTATTTITHERVRRTTTTTAAARDKRRRLEPFSSDEGEDEEVDITEVETDSDARRRRAKKTKRRLSARLLRPTGGEDNAPPLYGLVQDALDRLLSGSEPVLMGRDKFGNLVVRGRPV